MNYAVEMGSVAMIYIHTKFHKDWSRYSKVYKGRFKVIISLLLFFKIKKVGKIYIDNEYESVGRIIRMYCSDIRLTRI
jgi:hypothetical protein